MATWKPSIVHLLTFIISTILAWSSIQPTRRSRWTGLKECDWCKFNTGNVNEPVPPNIPKPHCKEVKIRLYGNSDHASDQLVTRLNFRNSALLVWFSKRQPAVETWVFSIRHQLHRYEKRYEVGKGTEIQNGNDGHPNWWTGICLWG